MLYNGSDTIRDVEWVIFDEVHYINDEEVREKIFRILLQLTLKKWLSVYFSFGKNLTQMLGTFFRCSRQFCNNSSFRLVRYLKNFTFSP